jgi:hypothetical protein
VKLRIAIPPYREAKKDKEEKRVNNNKANRHYHHHHDRALKKSAHIIRETTKKETNKIERTYSSEYAKFSEVFFTPHLLRRCCTFWPVFVVAS